MDRRARGVGATGAIALLAILALSACGRRSGSTGAGDAGPGSPPAPLALRMIADSARVETLHVHPPLEVRAWMTRVSPTRPDNVLPETPPAAPDTLASLDWPAPPPSEVDPGLKPPILRTPAALRLTSRMRGGASVELDVRVDEAGEVSDALWAGGADDSLQVAAAIESALGMRFYPALRAGQPVAVWCRQRFDFGSR